MKTSENAPAQTARGSGMWIVLALLSAFFAALTAILAKVGIEDIDSNLGTAIRTVVVLLMAWGIVWMTGAHHDMGDISRRSWVFLAASGVATGASWLCYFAALKYGDAARVVPIDKFSVVITMVLAFVFLHEALTWKVIGGGLLITAGTLLMVL